MTAIAHGGNTCSYKCSDMGVCNHADCPQCYEKDAGKRDALAAQKVMKMKSDAKTDGLLKAGKLIAEHPRDHQKAYITRAALEALAERAGVRFDWNDGDPKFHDDGVNDSEKRWDVAERKVAMDRIRELERIAGMQQSGVLSQQAANSLAKAASQSMDKMSGDGIKNAVNETLKEDIRVNEARVKDELRKQGASDADIAAAEKLLGSKPN